MDRLTSKAEKGFTLIELLVVIAIIGILTAVATSQFISYRKKSFDSLMVNDLRNAATAQEAYFAATGQYANGVADLNAEGFKVSPNVDLTITVNAGPPPSYTMTAVHSSCALGSSRTFNGATSVTGGTGCQ